ncbi:MAG: ribosome recycling factor [bacterium]
MENDLLRDVKEKMDKAVQSFAKDLTKIRTGRAHISLLDGIKVQAYGSPMPLNQVASLSAPEPRLIAIQPWDKSLMGAIEKAILTSDLGLMPTNDGKLIRIPIPQLTEERRKEIVKTIRKHAEAARVVVRNLRREGNESLKELESEGLITEDDERRLHADVQKMTDDHVARLDQILADKEKEIMEV